MNYIDLILLLIIFLCFAIGWKIRGIYLIFLVIAFFAGVFLANMTYTFFAKNFFNSVTDASKRFIISYLAAFVFFASIVVILGILVSKFSDSVNLTVFDKILGALILVAVGLIPFYFILNFMVNMNAFGFKLAAKKSLLFPLVEKYVILFLKLPVFKIIKMHLLALFSKKVII